MDTILIVDDDTFLLDMYALKFSQNNFDKCNGRSIEAANATRVSRKKSYVFVQNIKK